MGFELLAPHEWMEERVLSHLQQQGFINGERNIEAPTQRSLNDPGHRWRLNEELGELLEAGSLTNQALEELRDGPMFLSAVREAWHTLATAEVVAYLAAELSDHGFDANWAWRLVPQIELAVPRISISEGFYMCWLAVRDIASAYLRFPNSRDRLPHVLSHALEAKLQKVRRKAWRTSPFARHRRCSESAMAAVFSTAVTQLNDRYLLLAPSDMPWLEITQPESR